MLAPFLEEKWEWVDSGKYRRCNKGRQSREHLSKECREWKKEIHMLQDRVGNVLGDRKDGARSGAPKCKKGLGYDVWKAKIRPSNIAIGTC